MDPSKLVPFTGYYQMNVAPGAFLSIDTTVAVATQPPADSIDVTISLSMDGATATTFTAADGIAFDGTTLTIPNLVNLVFTRDYQAGRLVSFAGQVGGSTVTGSTYYNAVPLAAFVGNYFDVVTGKPVLAIAGPDDIRFDFAIFAGGGALQPVAGYRYNPGMFVLSFSGADGSAFTVMLGTAGAGGLAASIMTDTAQRYALSILSASPTLPAIVLPADQYGHAGAPTEWWWHVGTLQTATGRKFGFEVNACGVLDAMVFTEIAIADVENQVHYQIVNDQIGYAPAWAETDPTKPWFVAIPGPATDPTNGAVTMTAIGGNPLNMAVQAQFTDAATGIACRIDLQLFQQGPPLLVWGTGVQVLRPGTDPIKDNNFYYSLTNLAASGSITIGTETFPVTGLTWMDHEYGAFPDPGPGKKNVWTLQDIQLANGLHLSNYTAFGQQPQAGVAMPSNATLLLPDGQSVFVPTTTTPSDPMTIGDTTYFATYTVRMQSAGNAYVEFVVRNICPNQVFVDPLKINSGYEGVADCDMIAVYQLNARHKIELEVSSGPAWIEQSL